ncbi:uncharacterized protein LOC142318044 [Lycorma delicatula]|uniref:uncharacterized protein LOC142318044 n=1 Tax=Lycorma delicatula TaxID=130591 RepID=UPI003F50ECAA
MIDLNNVPGLQIKHELNGSNEFSYPVVKNRETKIISRRAANEFTMTSVALIVMNTMFFMYCWCAIYSYWRLVSRGFVSDVSSDESDTQSSATTVKTNQEEN